MSKKLKQKSHTHTHTHNTSKIKVCKVCIRSKKTEFSLQQGGASRPAETYLALVNDAALDKPGGRMHVHLYNKAKQDKN